MTYPIVVSITVILIMYSGGILLITYGLMDHSTPKSAVKITLDGNYTYYQLGRFQYESICSAQTKDSKWCGYLLPEINVDVKSAIAYSQQNCINNDQYFGSYNCKTSICTDTVGENDNYTAGIVATFCGIGFMLFTTLIIFQLLENLVHIHNDLFPIIQIQHNANV